MYIGFLSEHGKRIKDDDSFAYALERCMYDIKMSDKFEKEFKDYFSGGISRERMFEFKNDLIDWFFSGDWLYEEEEIYD